MRQPHVDDLVRLIIDIPDLELRRGDIGLIRSTWFAPHVVFEVEFARREIRALLQACQVEIEENRRETGRLVVPGN